MFDASLLNLPWATLVTLTSGYIGYFIANVGLKDHHKPIEVTFTTLIFGLLSMMVYQAVMWAGLNSWLATPPALLCAFIYGALWRRYGRKWMYRFLWNHDISWSDDTSSAWQSLFNQMDFTFSEIYVYLKDGSVLLSLAPGRFAGRPNGPVTLGNKGDIILYVTHRTTVGSNIWTECDSGVADDGWGTLATYIPAEQIARVDIRRVCR
ncbi:TPA: hypothetical protein IB163_004390 [Escherichia coli]|uniref:hypothetical protein n=1 Tax=Escherichia coli TaxID=562 RepID=UPI000D10878E|nr:hypothetical protein [Escherichia coli]MCT4760719.1 hypothetical protein [Escherichia coli]MDF8442899.1 hypothetical protein [Escherichia coli]MDF8524357.1 hypothetical protein [Escherichia coli]HBC1756135.1 hypothetical protein [Escherichia coli]HCC6742454.1 hypothetical protein [Escherichia coli]